MKNRAQPFRQRNKIAILAWLIALALPAYLFIYSLAYFPLAWRLAPDRVDGYGLDVILTQMIAGLLLPVCVLVTLFCTNGAETGKGFFAWRRDKPLWSIVVSVVFGLPAAAALVLAIIELSWFYPWYEYLFLPVLLLPAIWLLLLRATVLSKS